MAFTPILTPTVTSAFPTTAPMRDFLYVQDPVTGKYDIENEFTPATNQGNLMVIQSKILITLQTQRGEWAADTTFGLPQTTLIENSDNPDVLAQILSNEILTVQNVNNVIILSLDYNAILRNLTSSFSVTTAFGVTTVTVG